MMNLKGTSLALLLALALPAAAQAQGCGSQNPNCIVPTAPHGTSTNQAASTAFVQQEIGQAAGGSNGQIQYNNSGAFGGFTASGDATIATPSGTVTIQPNAITSGKIAAGAVTNAKIAAGSADTVKGSTNGSATSDIALVNCSAALTYSTSTHAFGCGPGGVPSYNIVNYGAVSGADTGSRNSNAMAAAITACGLAPGLIWVPAGNYQFATAQTISTSGCSFAGEGPGASILTYTGASIGVTIGPPTGTNITGVSLRNLGLVCSGSCLRVAQVVDVEQNIVFDNVYISAGNNAEGVRVTSNTASTQGSYSVHFIGGTVIADCSSVCLSINPQGVGLAQAIFIDHVFFNGYTTNALLITSGSGMFITNTRFERHPGTSNTNPAIHIDTTSKVAIRNSYIEDEANATQVELGGGVASLDIVGNYFTINVSAGSATSASAIKHNGSSSAPVSINIKDNTFAAAGTISKIVDFSALASSQIHIEDNYVNMTNGTSVFDFGASTASKAFSNHMIVGTVTYGIATSIGQTAVAVSGNTFSGTFSTSQSQAAQAVGCAAAPGASFTTNYMGQVTHC